jgi:VIT1/CCC1 family predicted Fe2+/Mn2+ transporter
LGKKDSKTREVFSKLSAMEQRHYEFWKKYCNGDKIRPNRLKMLFVLLLRWIIGASFAIKYLEGQETSTIRKYESLRNLIPAEDKAAFEEIIVDEKGHELSFAEAVQGSYVKYISFIVLGLADALVEIAGIHAGSLGIYKSTELTGLAGIIAGAAASIAMASAAFAQAKQGFQGSARLAAAYTGISYFVSAVFLATPYFLTKGMITAITSSVVVGVVMIAFISWYNSVMTEGHFRRDFTELAGIMLGATLALYAFGTVIRLLLGITV